MPNTREKLIELLDSGRMCHAVCSSRGHPVRTFESRMVDDGVVELLADHLIANGVTVQEWIPVDDPPKEDGKYLVFKQGVYGTDTETLRFAKDGRKVDKYDFHREWKNVWYRYDSECGHITIDTVTHWMPLPEPPKGE